MSGPGGSTRTAGPLSGIRVIDMATMLAASYGLPWYMVLVLSLAVGIPLSLTVAYVAFVLVRGDVRYSMAATLGIWMAIEELILQSPGRGRGQPVANPVEGDTLSILGTTLRADHLLVFVLAIGLVWSVKLLLTRSRHGFAIRVSAYDRDTAALLGISSLGALASATAVASASSPPGSSSGSSGSSGGGGGSSGGGGGGGGGSGW